MREKLFIILMTPVFKTWGKRPMNKSKAIRVTMGMMVPIFSVIDQCICVFSECRNWIKILTLRTNRPTIPRNIQIALSRLGWETANQTRRLIGKLASMGMPAMLSWAINSPELMKGWVYIKDGRLDISREPNSRLIYARQTAQSQYTKGAWQNQHAEPIQPTLWVETDGEQRKPILNEDCITKGFPQVALEGDENTT